MRPVTVRPALIAGALAFVLTGIGMQLVRNSGASLPQHSWWELLVLTVAIGALLAAGWRVREYVRGLGKAAKERADLVAQGEDPEAARVAAGPLPVDAPEAGFARRVLVCAQAASVGGPVLAGWYLGQLGVQIDRWQTGTGRSAIIVLAALTVGAIALCLSGFRVQKWCTLPEDQR